MPALIGRPRIMFTRGEAAGAVRQQRVALQRLSPSDADARICPATLSPATFRLASPVTMMPSKLF